MGSVEIIIVASFDEKVSPRQPKAGSLPPRTTFLQLGLDETSGGGLR